MSNTEINNSEINNSEKLKTQNIDLSAEGTEETGSRISSKWESVKKQLDSVAMWRLKGADEDEIAKRLGICKKTYLKYKNKYPEFREAVSFDKSHAEGLVEQALLKLALGYTVRVKKVHKLKNSHYDEREKKVEEERLETVEEEQNIPPNLSAQTFWLKSRCPEQWNEKDSKPDEEQDVFGIIEIPSAENGADENE